MITFAHRGLIQTENTVDSIVNASFCADWVECDVQVDKRGRTVLCHNRESTGELLTDLCEHPFTLNIMLDIKAPGVGQAEACATEIVNLTRKSRHKWKLCSFNEFCVRQLLALRKYFKLSYEVGLISSGVPLTMYDHLKVDFVSIDYNVLSREIVDHVHSSGKQVYTYTIKNKKQEELVETLAVDGIIKDIILS
jgi:glycerophosphoryl diester phosphodiesterase